MTQEFLILIVIIIVIGIFVADSVITAVLYVSLLINIIFLLPNIMSSARPTPIITPANDQQHEIPHIAPPVTTPGTKIVSGPDAGYGNAYEKYKKFDNGNYYSGIPKATGCVDDANIRIAQLRSRDRRSMDSATLKNSDYYKYHFGDELDRAESRVWWGNYDY